MGILAASGTVAGQPIRIYILNSLTQLSTLQFTHEKRWRLFHKAQVRLSGGPQRYRLQSHTSLIHDKDTDRRQ